MTESKIYADNYSCTFKEPGEFLDFLRDRKEHSQWLTAPSKSLQLQSIEKDSAFGNLYMQLYQHNGRAEILADTMENTSIMLIFLTLTFCDSARRFSQITPMQVVSNLDVLQ